MHMTQLLYSTFLLLTLCGFVSGYAILQPHSSVRIQLGSATTLHCHFHSEGYCALLWLKVPLQGAPVHIANVHSQRCDMKMFGEFRNNSRVRVILNGRNFSLSFLRTEITDVAKYICGIQCYDHIQFGNGSKLIVEETAGIEPTLPAENEENIKRCIYYYAVPVLSATNVALIVITIALIYRLIKKKKSDKKPIHGEDKRNTDDVIYSNLTFSSNLDYIPVRPQRLRRTSEEVVYQALKI
ncbi:uncharacterized protein LOC113657542 [Tachysurus fulvidraco]|uniref:uncharacterized protein LOC113657542 n=1 Tax=Tachysurus fulvidraco TaxID=1234273 RepID=UPI000F4EB1F8|nr:uncharacterized protein LOC113657542 [Tachysurus fulvidraco]